MSQLQPSTFIQSPVKPLQPQSFFAPKRQRPIGFVSEDSPISSGSPHIPEKDILLQFDSGRDISFDDAMHHCLFLGTTGSGKTASAVLPSLDRLIASGAYGIVPDVKGNLHRYIYPLAEKYGRLDDILEFGTSDTATPMNLLAEMDVQMMRSFFEKITMDVFKDQTYSRDWHMKGVAQSADCGQLLLFIQEKYKEINLSFRLIYEMISNPLEAQKIFTFFMKEVFDRSRIDHKTFVSTIENNKFHLLKKQDGKLSNSSTTVEEQLSWSLQAARDGLRNFLEAPNVERNFCHPGAMALELRPAIMANKIILLRFDLDTGPTAAMISRIILGHFYACVFNIGLDLPKDRRGFVCIDEFQEMADLGNGRFSDTAFAALAREFRCQLLVATQSMSGLAAHGDDPAAVSAFVSNCNQKIILYSDDPLTQELVSRYDPEMNLTTLESGECYAITYDSRNRRHEAGMETLHGAYASVKDILANAKPVAMPAREPEPERHLLQELVEWTEKTSREALQDSPQPRQQRFRALKRLEDRWGEEKSNYEYYESDRMKGEDMKKENKQEKMQGKAQGKASEFLKKEFPGLFIDEAKIAIPMGWVEQIAKSLRAFQATDIPIQIEILAIHQGRPWVVTVEGQGLRSGCSFGVGLLNGFLASAASLCVICGKKYEGEIIEDDDLLNGALPVCKSCREAFGLGEARDRKVERRRSKWRDDE